WRRGFRPGGVRQCRPYAYDLSLGVGPGTRRKVMIRIAAKHLQAMSTTKVIGFPGVLRTMLGRGWVYGHPADRVFHCAGRLGGIFHDECARLRKLQPHSY